jgi:hypothetical protein
MSGRLLWAFFIYRRARSICLSPACHPRRPEDFADPGRRPSRHLQRGHATITAKPTTAKVKLFDFYKGALVAFDFPKGGALLLSRASKCVTCCAKIMLPCLLSLVTIP